jgi:hypothetical protein
MARQRSKPAAPVWLGLESGDGDGMGAGKLWVGQHATDQDILILDPSVTDPSGEVLSLYSLTQHRTRSFSRETVLERITGLTDEVATARAKRAYAERDAHRADHMNALDEAQTERRARQRDGLIAAHRRYVEGLGLTYQGIQDTATTRRTGRATKCHACGIPLDDFAGAACAICAGLLCSCAACACGK